MDKKADITEIGEVIEKKGGGKFYTGWAMANYDGSGVQYRDGNFHSMGGWTRVELDEIAREHGTYKTL